MYCDLLVDTFSYDSIYEKDESIESKPLSKEDDDYFCDLFCRAVNQKTKKNNVSKVSLNERPIKKIKQTSFYRDWTIQDSLYCTYDTEDLFEIFKNNKTTNRKRLYSCFKSTQTHDNEATIRQPTIIHSEHQCNIFEHDFFIMNLIQWFDDMSNVPVLMCLNRSIFDCINNSNIWKHFYYSNCYIPLKYEHKFELSALEREKFFHVLPVEHEQVTFKNENDMKNLCYFVRSVLYKKMYHNIKNSKCKTQKDERILKNWKTIELHQIVRKMCEIEDYHNCMNLCSSQQVPFDYYHYLRAFYPCVKNIPKSPHQKLNCCLTNTFINRHFLNNACYRLLDIYFGREMSLNIQNKQNTFFIRKTRDEEKYLCLHDIATNINIHYNALHFEKTNREYLNLPIQYTFFYDMISRFEMVNYDKTECIKQFCKKVWTSHMFNKLCPQYDKMQYFDVVDQKSDDRDSVSLSKNEIKWDKNAMSFFNQTRQGKFKSTILSDMIVSEMFHVLDWCLPIQWSNCKKNNLFEKKINNPQNILSLFLQNDFGIHMIQMIYYVNVNWNRLCSIFKENENKQERVFLKFWLFFRDIRMKTPYFLNFDYKKDENDMIKHENKTVKDSLNIWLNWKNNSQKRLDYCSNNVMTDCKPFVLVDMDQIVIEPENNNLWHYISKNILKSKFRQLYRSDHKSPHIKFCKSKTYFWDDCTFEKLIYYKLIQYKCIQEKSKFKIQQNQIQENEPDLIYQLLSCNNIMKNNQFATLKCKTTIDSREHYNLIQKEPLDRLIETYGKPYNHPILWNLFIDRVSNVSYGNTFFKFEKDDLRITREHPKQLNSKMTHKNWYHSSSERDVCFMENHFLSYMKKHHINKHELPFDRMIRSLFVDKKLCRLYNQQSYAMMFSSLAYLLRKKWYTKPNLWIHWLFGLSYSEWNIMINQTGTSQHVLQVLDDAIKCGKSFDKKHLKTIIQACEQKYIEIGWWLCSHYKNK